MIRRQPVLLDLIAVLNQISTVFGHDAFDVEQKRTKRESMEVIVAPSEGDFC